MILYTKNIQSPCFQLKQGRKRPLDTPKYDREKREREKGRKRDIEGDGEIRERERDVRDRERESERESHRALPYRLCALVENLREISQAEKKSAKKGLLQKLCRMTMSRNYYRKLSQEIIS